MTATPYIDSVAPCPIENREVANTPENVFRFAVVEALGAQDDFNAHLTAFARLPREAPKDEQIAAYAPAALAFAQLGQWFTTAWMLKLAGGAQPIDQAELADNLVAVYEAGDVMGEMLWDWADEQGIDYLRVIAERKSQRESRETTGP